MSKRRGSFLVPGLAIAGLGLFLFLRSALARATERVTVKGIRARLKNTSFTSTTVEIYLDIVNATGLSVPVDSFDGRIRYGGTILAPLVSKEPVVLQHGQHSTMVMQAQIQYTHLAANIVELLQSGQFISNLTVEGVLRAGGISVPVQQNILAIG